MCVLQDFEAITPNLLARTIETVEGGGLIVLLLKTMTSLRQLYTMAMVRGNPSSPLHMKN
jgi:N-acetyltransferase 10